MSCFCGCVSIPQRVPEICPKCLLNDRLSKTLNLGISEEIISLSDVSNILSDDEIIQLGNGNYSFHYSDFGDLCACNLSTKDLFVLQRTNDKSSWITWFEYLRRIS